MKNYFWKTVFLFFFLTINYAQILNDSILNQMKPRNIGPGGMSGRITSIDVVLKHPETMYVGTASGGIWKTTSGGVRWEPIFEKEVTASIGAVAIQQSNPSVVWAGTGEGNPRNSLNGGYGVFKSLDGGRTWESMGLKKTRHIHKIVIDPKNPNVVYVGAIGSPWGEHEERGLYKTTDGGVTWKKILFTNIRSGIADLVMDPENPNKLYAALWEHKRDPWFFHSGGEGSGLYITHNGGDTWKKVTDKEGFPKGELGRIGIAVAPSKPDIVYAIVESKKNALYKSLNGGVVWEKVNDKNEIGNRPFYYSDLFVSPKNENRVYTVFTFVNVSQDGGKSFQALMPAYGANNGVHPDHHAWWIHPENGDFMIDGNDGGLNITYDGGKTWRFVGNIPVGQFYHINVDNEYPYNVYGGMQDNGSWAGPAYVWKAQGIRNSYWQEIAFGDGFDVVPDPEDARYGYAMSQQGYVQRYDRETGANYYIRPFHPDPEVRLRFNWNAAIAQDPFDTSTIYFGSQFVHKSTNKGTSWELISSDLTTNDPEKLKQAESGGLTMDATGAENHCTILVIEPSPLEKDMLWAATDDGNVWMTQNGGGDWKLVNKGLKGLPKGSWICQIKASNKNKGEALLVANNYRRFDYTPYVYRTTNYGNTWSRIVKEGQVASYALSIVEDTVNPKLLFLGTDDGLYFSINAGANWQKWTNGFPTVPVKDMLIQPREQDLVIGTFGRSNWVLDDIRPLRAIAADASILDKEVHLFSPPTAYQAKSIQPSGTRFAGDAIYQGENKPNGARLSFYYKKKTKEATSDSKKNTVKKEEGVVSKKDSLYLTIFDGDRKIRTLKRKAPEQTGLYMWYWGMQEKGAPRPSRAVSKIKAESAGVAVLPGEYKVVLTLGKERSEQVVEVKKDPRIRIEDSALQERYEASIEIQKWKETTYEALQELAKSKENVSSFKQRMEKEKDSLYKLPMQKSDSIIKKIDVLFDLFLGKKDKRQGIVKRSENHVMARVNNADWYVSSRMHPQSNTEEMLQKQAKESLTKGLEEINLFYKESWPEYLEYMKEIELKSLKINTKTFSVE